MSKHFTLPTDLVGKPYSPARRLPTDLVGKPYSPARSYSWLTEAYRSECAHQMDCALSEVEYRLDAQAAMDAKIAERREYEDPVGASRGRY